MFRDTRTPLDDIETLQNKRKQCSLLVVHFVSMLYYLASIWCILLSPQQCMHSVGHGFHQLMYDFHLNDNPFLMQLLPKVILASGRSLQSHRRRSTSFKRCLIGFMLGDCGLHGNTMIVWSLTHLTIKLLVCFGLLSNWNTHSFAFFLTSQITSSGYHVRCYNNACYSFFL